MSDTLLQALCAFTSLRHLHNCLTPPATDPARPPNFRLGRRAFLDGTGKNLRGLRLESGDSSYNNEDRTFSFIPLRLGVFVAISQLSTNRYTLSTFQYSPHSSS